MRARIAGAKPIDLTNYRHTISSDDLRHAWNKHGQGNETSKNNIPLKKEDLGRIPDIIARPDDVEISAWKQGKPIGVIYKKHMDDGSDIVVEHVRKGGQLAFKTMYRSKKEGGDMMLTRKAPRSLRPETGSTPNAAQADIVQQPTQRVNNAKTLKNLPMRRKYLICNMYCLSLIPHRSSLIPVQPR